MIDYQHQVQREEDADRYTKIIYAIRSPMLESMDDYTDSLMRLIYAEVP